MVSFKMRAAGAHAEAIRAFESAYSRLTSGQSTMLPSSELEPAGDVAGLQDLPNVDPGDVLGQVALIKRNGGLATTMGLQQPNSLVGGREGM